MGLRPDRLLIGAAGRLSAEKGFDLLIRAVHPLLQGGLDVDLVIVGEGDERPRLEALIAELGLADRVQLLGYRSDLPDWYEAMDVFALSSLREGLPNVLLEAMALETPVVATRIAGVPRLVRHEENGLLVEPGSVEALAGALGRTAPRRRPAQPARPRRPPHRRIRIQLRRSHGPAAADVRPHAPTRGRFVTCLFTRRSH